jgi:hypothetical protein
MPPGPSRDSHEAPGSQESVHAVSKPILAPQSGGGSPHGGVQRRLTLTRESWRQAKRRRSIGHRHGWFTVQEILHRFNTRGC